jgi:hypothetical protein
MGEFNFNVDRTFTGEMTMVGEESVGITDVATYDKEDGYHRRTAWKFVEELLYYSLWTTIRLATS